MVALALAGCSKAPSNLKLPGQEGPIGDLQHRFTVLSRATLAMKAARSEILLPGSAQGHALLDELAQASPVSLPRVGPSDGDPAAGAREEQMLLGIPLGLLNENYVFGGVITRVTDGENESLGALKLFDLSPVHARLNIARAGENYILAVSGCVRNCSESSANEGLVGFPIVGFDEPRREVIVDLAAVGQQLDLIKMLDPGGYATSLKSRYSKTTSIDYSTAALVFDVDSHMVPLAADPNDVSAPETLFTARWYLKLASAFHPAFVARPATEGVGFFLTERGAESHIQRWSYADVGHARVKYFIKGVPAEFRAPMDAAFDDWNSKLEPILGRALLEREFVEETDPRAVTLVAGDVRYNVIEWDVSNRAPYAALGPSIANQFTGEIFSAHVLIQGPQIVKAYSKWFRANEAARALREAGKGEGAERLLKRVEMELASEARAIQAATPRFELKLGASLRFRPVSQLAAFKDPVLPRWDFEPVPEGVTYATYMAGYFQEMLSHELGHNLGLRHNFRGNLGASGREAGKVSRSVMEYLTRGFRHLDRISIYDVMAIAYGYTGQEPARRDWFCTDEDTVDSDPQNSPECANDDATADPYAWYESRLERAIDLLVARGSAHAPEWSVPEIAQELTGAVEVLGAYAARAESTGKAWTNFFTSPDRPVRLSEVRPWVLERIRARICDPSLAATLESKESDEAREKAASNLAALRARVNSVLLKVEAIPNSGGLLSCGLSR